MDRRTVLKAGAALSALGIRTVNASAETVLYIPNSGAIYVAPDGNDLTGTGERYSPFRTATHASAVAQPGDTIFLRPGIYAPFSVENSGKKDSPITFMTLPGEEQQAIIEGDLMQHVFYDGPGVAKSNAVRDGIFIRAKDYIHIRNLTIRNLWRGGIFVTGVHGEQHGHHVFAGNRIYMVGASAIHAQGIPRFQATIGADAVRTQLPTDDILIEHNDISQTNVVTDFNNDATNSQGEPGGVVEAISITNGVSNVVTRFNDIHDSRQYGIDYKVAVSGGAIYGNRVWNIERYGIYIDAALRFVEDVAIYNNEVWNCRHGIAMAREPANSDLVQVLRRIIIYNNLIWNTGRSAMYLHEHHFDDPVGAIEDVTVAFNTIYNAAREGGSFADFAMIGWVGPEWDSANDGAGVVSNFRVFGNIVWNSTRSVIIRDNFTGNSGFSVEQNLFGPDPLFVNPSYDPTDPGSKPDLRLLANSPAISLVDSNRVAAPFYLDAQRVDRRSDPAAGAYHKMAAD